MGRVAQVRRALALKQNTEQVGDGAGSENTINCSEMNELEVYVTYKFGTSNANYELRFYWSDDGINFFQKGFYTDGASPTVSLQAFTMTGNADQTLVFAVPVHGTYCRIGAKGLMAQTDTSLSLQVTVRMR